MALSVAAGLRVTRRLLRLGATWNGRNGLAFGAGEEPIFPVFVWYGHDLGPEVGY